MRTGHLYSIWVSNDESGASMGYNAAGGSGFSGGVDDVGITGYQSLGKFYL